jgi:deoxyribodipyrimidine photo-lyase
MNIFIFNRGLRVSDNTTLIDQMKQMGHITPIFIFTPEQIDKKKNEYFSNNSVQFMIESLYDLANDLKNRGGKLYYFYGHITDVLLSISKDHKILSIGMNFDYTPYARQRSSLIQQFCSKNKIKFFEKEDYLLHPILSGQTKKKDDSPYLMFTPFKLFCMANLKVAPIDKFNKFVFKTATFKSNINKLESFYIPNRNINVNGGRTNGLKILKNINTFSKYEKERDYFTYNTTFLSAHNHYMTISIREEYWAIINSLGKKSGIISELYWREFYTNIVYFFPHVLQGQLKSLLKKVPPTSMTSLLKKVPPTSMASLLKKVPPTSMAMTMTTNISFKQKFEKIKLPPFNKKWYDAWCEGKTGFPIVDAGMRQLNLTGFMHNRSRMITMSFLIKFMHIDWRYGEKYFATKLVDYDAMMNNSGVQWCAGCGTDAQPYFRYFNPWIQQKKYDPKCIYIKKYVKELQDIDPKIIHKWDIICNQKNKDTNIKYPEPILDHAKEIKIALKRYKTLS